MILREYVGQNMDVEQGIQRTKIRLRARTQACIMEALKLADHDSYIASTIEGRIGKLDCNTCFQFHPEVDQIR